MGATNDPMSVVDPKCSVIGIARLRVADSSIFPRINNGSLNAPSIMIGEKAADHISQRAHFQLKIPSPGYTHRGKQIKDNKSEKQRVQKCGVEPQNT